MSTNNSTVQPTKSDSDRKDQELPEASKFTCAARRQGTAGGNDPADCDWPYCGCDESVMDAYGPMVYDDQTQPIVYPSSSVSWLRNRHLS